jgi:hypothetical protein
VPLLIIQVFVIYSNQIPELRSFQKDSSGYFINPEGERIPWYSNPYLLVNISCMSTIASIAATVLMTYHEAE